VLQELNTILLIVGPLLTPVALILINRVVRARAHGFPFFFFLGSKIPPLLVVFGHVDVISITIVALDPFFLLGIHSYKFFECPLVIHGVVIHLKSFEFFRE
jgi:predicted membrane chloride channel (bestrophin family)